MPERFRGKLLTESVGHYTNPASFTFFYQPSKAVFKLSTSQQTNLIRKFIETSVFAGHEDAALHRCFNTHDMNAISW